MNNRTCYVIEIGQGIVCVVVAQFVNFVCLTADWTAFDVAHPSNLKMIEIKGRKWAWTNRLVAISYKKFMSDRIEAEFHVSGAYPDGKELLLFSYAWRWFNFILFFWIQQQWSCTIYMLKHFFIRFFACVCDCKVQMLVRQITEANCMESNERSVEYFTMRMQV